MNSNKGTFTICHVISGDIWGGAEAQAYSLIKALSALENINIKVIVFNNAELYRKLSSKNINVYIVSERDRNVISMTLDIYRKMKRFNPDIVHVHGYKENFTSGIAAKLCAVKLLRTYHGKGMITGKGLHTYIEKINEKYFTQGSIAVSNDLKKFLVGCQFNEAKIRVIHNGLSCDIGENGDISVLKEAIGIVKDDRVIGIVGRLVPVKNHHCFLESAKLILRSHANVYFLMIGDGPLMDELKRYARSLGIDDRVIFLGFKSNARNLLEMFDVFAMTSLHEGVPISMMEAMCAGVPVVSTQVGGIPEIIQNGHNGLLVADNDCMAFSKACLRLLDDSALYEEVSRNAFSDMRNKYSLINNVTETVKLYNSYLL